MVCVCGYTPKIDGDRALAAHGLALKTTGKGIPSNGWSFPGAPRSLPDLDGEYLPSVHLSARTDPSAVTNDLASRSDAWKEKNWKIRVKGGLR